MEFHKTFQASAYLWGKYVHAKIKGKGPVPFELLPFIVLDGFFKQVKIVLLWADQLLQQFLLELFDIMPK